jgi:hypothetical protein
MSKRKDKVNTRSDRPTWETVQGDQKYTIDPSVLMKDSSIENALLQRGSKPNWHKDYDELAYYLGNNLWIMALRSSKKLHQHAWRVNRYAEPATIATWAAFRSSAERAQIKKIELEGFKAEHGQYTRPSKKDISKAVLDENQIKDLLNEGKSIQEIADMCTTTKSLIYKIAFIHQKHLRIVP